MTRYSKKCLKKVVNKADKATGQFLGNKIAKKKCKTKTLN